jgi:hypothetical protein
LHATALGGCIGRTAPLYATDRITAMKAPCVLASSWLALATAVAGPVDTPQTERPAQADAMHAHAGGIWKAAVPAKAMAAEFERYDVYGLAVGARIQTDCSLNWVDPDDGRRYCFASGTSLVYFLDSPRTFLAQARGYWQSLRPATR